MDIVVGFVKDLLKNAYELDRGKAVLLAAVEKNYPGYDKRALAELDLPQLQQAFAQWLQHEFKKEPVPFAVKSLWFGLIRVQESQRPDLLRTVLHVTGSDLTPAEDKDWASSVTYHPKAPYADLEAYRRLSHSVHEFRRVNDGMSTGDLENIIFLGVSYLIIKNSLKSISSLVIGETGETFVGFGYNSGDCWFIGRLTEKGLKKR